MTVTLVKGHLSNVGYLQFLKWNQMSLQNVFVTKPKGLELRGEIVVCVVQGLNLSQPLKESDQKRLFNSQG